MVIMQKGLAQAFLHNDHGIAMPAAYGTRHPSRLAERQALGLYFLVVFDHYFAFQVEVALYNVGTVAEVRLAGGGAKGYIFSLGLVVGAAFVAAGFTGFTLWMCHGERVGALRIATLAGLKLK